MNHKLSISIDPELLAKADSKLKNGSYRNRSHLFELAIKKMLRGDSHGD
ncbi:MAG: ribbon-helix-helix domain-containing protein [Nanoarchaeota archaeon]|nr:ribbon-helix-helix domain-containing protein [Nanoarchaeota archaeon]